MPDKKKRSFSDINKKYSFLDEGVEGLKDRNVSRADQSRKSSNGEEQKSAKENNLQKNRRPRPRQSQPSRERSKGYDSNLGFTIKMDPESIEKERRRLERKARMEREKKRRKRRFIFFLASIVCVILVAILIKTAFSSKGKDEKNKNTNKVTETKNENSQEFETLKGFMLTNSAIKMYKENNTSTELKEIPAGTYLESYGTINDFTKVKYLEEVGFVETKNLTNASKGKELKVINGLLVVNDEYSLPRDYEPNFNSEAKQAFDNMVYKAKIDDIKINSASNFLSYDMLAQSYTDGVSSYGEYKKDGTEVELGHSEHQTGLAIDVVDEDYENKYSVKFAETKAYDWLFENAHKNGFVFRYPKDKEDITGRKFEPWHLRYVGTKAALEMKEKDLTLEEYLNLAKVENNTTSSEPSSENKNNSELNNESNKNSNTDE
ncbi:D-alanyl-D-alanine carboxypeptidase family protein [Miniphocaeibacter massiliensis]|uniref:D-alanyl-D-alanine carboxypeptidase family protein n=1 Tax=Miniphocaeibacter massiliensis TaxID=2041841 RepID=UPI000C1C0E1F|nr:D-alanyl-D-alanine carboxypeptidase family protein [Miniphocaeibacter massiliensis]